MDRIPVFSKKYNIKFGWRLLISLLCAILFALYEKEYRETRGRI